MTLQAYLDSGRRRARPPTISSLWPNGKSLWGQGLRQDVSSRGSKEDFGLGHGHALAIWAVFKSEGWAAGTASAATPSKTPARSKR